MRTLIVAGFLALAAPARAQVELGAGVGPDSMLGGAKEKKEKSVGLLPLALATTLAFDATTWATVTVSSHPAAEITELMRKGYYKLEVLQLVLIGKEASAPLKDLVKERDKGSSLRQIADKRKVDFDLVYERSLALDRRVVGRYLPSVMRVEVSTSAPKSEAWEKRR